MLEFPWNKKNKNLNGKGTIKEHKTGKPERTPYTLDEVDSLIKKYHSKRQGTNHNRPVKAKPTSSQSGQKPEVVSEREPETDSVESFQPDSPSHQKEVMVDVDNTDDVVEHHVNEIVANIQKTNQEENEDPWWKELLVQNPQVDALSRWIKDKLFESLWGLLVSDLNGEKIYSLYGFHNTELKSLLLIPPILDAEMQQVLQHGKIRESLFRTDRNKMLYYMDIENFRVALLLDEEKLNMGMLFSIVKPAIEERIKKIGPIS